MVTLPHGDSQEGSPSFEAFHRAKSLGFLFSVNLSDDILKSPKKQTQKEAYCTRRIE